MRYDSVLRGDCADCRPDAFLSRVSLALSDEDGQRDALRDRKTRVEGYDPSTPNPPVPSPPSSTLDIAGVSTVKEPDTSVPAIVCGFGIANVDGGGLVLNCRT